MNGKATLLHRFGRAGASYTFLGVAVVVTAVVVVSLLTWIPNGDRAVAYPVEVIERILPGVVERVDEQVASLLGVDEETVQSVREDLLGKVSPVISLLATVQPSSESGAAPPTGTSSGIPVPQILSPASDNAAPAASEVPAPPGESEPSAPPATGEPAPPPSEEAPPPASSEEPPVETPPPAEAPPPVAEEPPTVPEEPPTSEAPAPPDVGTPPPPPETPPPAEEPQPTPEEPPPVTNEPPPPKSEEPPPPVTEEQSPAAGNPPPPKPGPDR